MKYVTLSPAFLARAKQRKIRAEVYRFQCELRRLQREMEQNKLKNMVEKHEKPPKHRDSWSYVFLGHLPKIYKPKLSWQLIIVNLGL